MGWVALLVMAACGSDREPAAARPDQVLKKSPLPEAPPVAPLSPYESPGNLAAADEPLLGAAVPRVAKVLSTGEHQARAVVENVPFEAVERFYERTLVPGSVERLRHGVRFADATPRDPGNRRARVEVFVQRTARGTVVQIFDETPSGRPPPQGEEALRQAQGIGGRPDWTKRVEGVTE